MTVRSHLRIAAKIPALIIAPAVVFGPIVAAISLLVFATEPLTRFALPPILVFCSALLGYHMFQTYDWVEFDGAELRAKHLYTRRLTVYPLGRIVGVRALGAVMKRGIEARVINEVIDRVMGPVRGYEIMIAGRRNGVAMAVGDTANAEALARAVAAAVGTAIEMPG